MSGEEGNTPGVCSAIKRKEGENQGRVGSGEEFLVHLVGLSDGDWSAVLKSLESDAAPFHFLMNFRLAVRGLASKWTRHLSQPRIP